MTDRDAFIPVEFETAQLSLAVELVDADTGDPPAGNPRVRLEGLDSQPFRKPGGFRVFTDLPDSTVTVVVNGGEHYADERMQVTLADPSETDADAYVHTIELTPR